MNTPQDQEALAERVPDTSVPPFADGGIGSLMCEAARAYREDYVLCTEGPDHEPTEHEQILLEDFFNGLISDERFFGPIRALLARSEALEAECADLTKALTGLTCGGSEFFIRKGDRLVADVDACVAWVRRAKDEAYRRSIEAIRERKVAEKRAEVLEAVLHSVQRQAENSDHNLERQTDAPLSKIRRAFRDIAQTAALQNKEGSSNG